MDHIEVQVRCLPGFSEILMAEMGEIGFDTFIDTDDGFNGYVSETDFSEAALKALFEKYSPASNAHYEWSRIPQKNWNEEWEKSYEPIVIDDRCVVRASFHQMERRFPYEIIINPKMSFGTGHHETTFLMLSQQLALDHKNRAVLDVGCGTGILSVMATKLGAKFTDACDIDEWSIENSKENRALNDCKNLRIVQGTVRSAKFDERYDIILANINRNVLLDEIPVYAGLLKENAHLVVSGFYKEDISPIRQTAEREGLFQKNQTLKNNWAAILFQKEKN